MPALSNPAPARRLGVMRRYLSNALHRPILDWIVVCCQGQEVVCCQGQEVDRTHRGSPHRNSRTEHAAATSSCRTTHENGAGPAPRGDQIAGTVQRVWAESRLCRKDAESLLKEWLAVAGCVIRDEEFAMLLSKARAEFARLTTTSEADGAPHWPAYDLVQCLYWDVQRLEINGPSPWSSNGLTAPHGQ